MHGARLRFYRKDLRNCAKESPARELCIWDISGAKATRGELFAAASVVFEDEDGTEIVFKERFPSVDDKQDLPEVR